MIDGLKKQMSLKRQIILFVTGGLLSLAPFWAMPLQTRLGYSLYTTGDGLMFLGLSLIAGMLFRVILPSFLLKAVDRLARFISKRDLLVSVVLILATLPFLLWVNREILNSFLSSGDEHSCYFLAECLRIGKLWVPTHPLQEFFDVVHVGSRDGKWFSVYPIGWPLLWALGLELGVSDWMNPLLSCGALFFFFAVAKRLFGQATAWLGILLTLSGPFFYFTSASYFSHSTCLFMIGLFLYSFLKWSDAKNKKELILWACLTAFAVGYGLMTRYLTMAAVSGPLLVYKAWPLFTRERKWRADEKFFIGILGAFFIAVYVQNFLVTGNPIKAPNSYDKSWEKLGFDDGYTPLTALRFILARLFYLGDWFPPIFIVLFLSAFGNKRLWTPVQRMFRYGAFFIAFGYYFYFSWGGNQFGPRYYYEALPFLGIILAEHLVYLWKTKPEAFQKSLIGFFVAALISGGFLFQKQSEFYSLASAQRKALYVATEQTVEKPALVFIKGFLGAKLVLGEEDAVRNHPLLNTAILYAHDKGADNIELIKAFPERRAYRGWYDREHTEARLEEII